jgi:hypothetical protein
MWIFLFHLGENSPYIIDINLRPVNKWIWDGREDINTIFNTFKYFDIMLVLLV